VSEAIARQLHIDLHRKQPLSEQIQEEIRRFIVTGSLRPGDPLPTVRQLAGQLKVNFNTVARAYRALDFEGLIITRQGRGTFVTDTERDEALPAFVVQPDREIRRIIALLEQAGMAREEAFTSLAQALRQEHDSLLDSSHNAKARRETRGRARRSQRHVLYRARWRPLPGDKKRLMKATKRRIITQIK